MDEPSKRELEEEEQYRLDIEYGMFDEPYEDSDDKYNLEFFNDDSVSGGMLTRIL